ncbi:MAG TPA: PQQ-binding-like beta-propeller repeat protein [Holophagaceae bacterium]
MRLGFSMFLLASALLAAAPGTGYRSLRTFPIGGPGGWDYLTLDAGSGRLFVTHGDEVVVLEAKTGKVVGRIPDTPGVHGVALVPQAGRGYISQGRSNDLAVFDLKTLKKLGSIPAGKKPDAIISDATDGLVLAFNGASQDATVVDAATGAVRGTLPLGGQPEYAVADGKGHVYVNLEDKSEVLQLDPRAPKVTARWPLAPGESPSALAMDPESRRLFAGCHNQKLVVLDADTGRVVTSLPIGRGVDAARFDAGTGLLFVACGDGTTTVIRATSKDHYEVVDTLKTRVSARTLELDPATHDLYLPFADVKPNPAGGRPSLVPGTFAVLVVGRP